MMNSTGSSRKISRRGVGTGCKERRGMPEHFPDMTRTWQGWPRCAAAAGHRSRGSSLARRSQGSCSDRLHPAFPTLSTMLRVAHVVGSEELQRQHQGGDTASPHLTSPLPALLLPKSSCYDQMVTGESCVWGASYPNCACEAEPEERT